MSDWGRDSLLHRSLSRPFGVVDGSTNALITSIPVSGQPSGLAIDPYDQRIYVSDVSQNSVQIIDGVSKQVIGSVVVGSGPVWSAIDVFHHLLYVGNTQDNTFSVISVD
jgi:YVTN family beta-propeller protein